VLEPVLELLCFFDFFLLDFLWVDEVLLVPVPV
jgi:hypothetical protein